MWNIICERFWSLRNSRICRAKVTQKTSSKQLICCSTFVGLYQLVDTTARIRSLDCWVLIMESLGLWVTRFVQYHDRHTFARSNFCWFLRFCMSKKPPRTSAILGVIWKRLENPYLSQRVIIRSIRPRTLF